MKTVAEPPGACPKCRRNPLFLETSGVWGDRLYCLCGYSRDLPDGCKPSLEIYADDVKASHGATTGALADKARFYMQSRGLFVAAGCFCFPNGGPYAGKPAPKGYVA
jgi:hypothetical protein